jgi:hypothetical protein
MVKNPEAAGRGRIGGFTLAAKHDPKQYTAPARAAFQARFLDEVDPDRTLPELERLRRAKAARSAWYARLALLSARARALRKAGARTMSRTCRPFASRAGQARKARTSAQPRSANATRNSTAAVSNQSAAVCEEGHANDHNLVE